MIQPTRSSNITQMFDELPGDIPPADDLEYLKNVGEPLFRKEDIAATSDQLNQIFRAMCVENNISLAYFEERYTQYAINKLAKLPQSAANNKANTLKQLRTAPRMTLRKFVELTTQVLGFTIDDICIRITDRQNRKQSFNLGNNIDDDSKDD